MAAGIAPPDQVVSANGGIVSQQIPYSWDHQLTYGKALLITPQADADAPNNSIYFSTTANALVYKDAAGDVSSITITPP